ncbi:MAG: hypothetical protein JNJ47_07820, partial [Alphaproteobacteria bacterium]|nr:hypothetical protein [Alphaproteobacteria bacterium]
DYQSITKHFFLTGGSLCLAGYFFYKKQSTPARIFASFAGLTLSYSLISNFFFSSAKSTKKNSSSASDEENNYSTLSASSSSDILSQKIEFGEQQIILPRIMTITQETPGTQIAALPSVCHILFFSSYTTAIKQNKHVNQLHERERSRPKSYGDLKLKLETVYNDMREQAEKTQTVAVTEDIIRALQIKINELDESDESVPAKMERDAKKRASRTLLMQEGRAILILVPNPEN